MKKIFLILTMILFVSSCTEDSNSLDSNLFGSWNITMQTNSQDIFVNESVEILNMWNPMTTSFIVEVYDSTDSTTESFNLNYINIQENYYCSVNYDDYGSCVEFEFSNVSKMSMSTDLPAIDYQINCTPDLSACRPTFSGYEFYYGANWDHQSNVSMWDENTFEMIYNDTFNSFSDFYDDYRPVAISVDNSIDADAINVPSGESFFFKSLEFLSQDYLYSIVTFHEDGTLTQSTVTDCDAIDPDYYWDCTQYDCNPVYDSDDMVVGCEDFGGCETITNSNECWQYDCNWNYDNNSCESYNDYYNMDLTWSTSGNILSITQSYGPYSMTENFDYSVSNSGLLISQSMSYMDSYYNTDYDDMDLDGISDEVYGLSASQIADLIQTNTIHLSSYSGSTVLDNDGNAVPSPLLRPKFILPRNRKITK